MFSLGCIATLYFPARLRCRGRALAERALEDERPDGLGVGAVDERTVCARPHRPAASLVPRSPSSPIRCAETAADDEAQTANRTPSAMEMWRTRSLILKAPVSSRIDVPTIEEGARRGGPLLVSRRSD